MSLHVTGSLSFRCLTAVVRLSVAMETGDSACPKAIPGLPNARPFQTLHGYNPVDFTQYIPDCSSDAKSPPTAHPVVAEVFIPTWALQYVIQVCGNDMEKITKKLPHIQVIIIREGNKIILRGPLKQVHIAEEFLKSLTSILQLNATMVVNDVHIHRKFYCHIIGRQGATINRIRTETFTTLYFPGDVKNPGLPIPPDAIRIVGFPAGVAAAKQKILQIVAEMERFWALRDKTANEVQAGLRREVLHVDKNNFKHVLGRRGANLKRIRKKTGASIIVGGESGDSIDIVIAGEMENVDKARKTITDIVQNMTIASHRMVRETSMPTDIADNLEARQEEKKLLRHCETARVDPQIAPMVMGRNCTKIIELAEKHDVQVLLHDSHVRESHNAKRVTIVGSESKVKAAKDDLDETIRELETHIIESVKIYRRVHGHLVGAKGKKVRELQDQFEVSIWFPKLDYETSFVTIRGRKENVEKAKTRLLSLATYFTQVEDAKFETMSMRARPLKARGFDGSP